MRGHLMVGLKQKSKLSFALYISIHVLAATLVFGCHNNKSFYDVNRNNIDKVPLLMEDPDSPLADDPVDQTPVIVELKEEHNAQEIAPEEAELADDTNELPPAPAVQEEEQDDEPVVVIPKPPKKPITPVPARPKPTPQPVAPTPVEPKKPSTPAAPAASVTKQASKFIQVAFWVVQNEARKIGTPCNFYVSRVLELSGYSDDNFLANDFDLYAKKHFSTYKDERFVTASLEAERARLKRYLWSYPERTPFILQWERPKPKPGHIAIVERIGDQLVVYQASLNRHIARREQTTIDRLLSTSRGANLTVYSEFVAR